MVTRRVLPAVLTAFGAAISGCRSTESQINYGLNHFRMGLYNQAIPSLLSAARSLEKEDPPDPRLVEVLIALGTMAEGTKRDDLAAGFYPRALKAAEALRPTDDVRLRDALANAGLFYSFHDRAREAVPLLERAAALSEKFEDQEYHAIDLDNLASAHQNLDQFQEASELQLRALKVANQLTSAAYPRRTRGTILHNLATSYVELGRYQDAEECFKESLTVLMSGGREVEPWRVKTARKSYADLLRKTGRAEEARELESAALEPGAPAAAPDAAADPGRG